MESALVVLRNICGPEDKDVLETVFKGCLPLIYEHSTLDIIILEHFDSAELLDSTLLMLYNLAREVLLTRDLVDTSINVLFNQPAERFNERKWDIAFFSETSLSSLFRYHVGRFFTIPIPKIARIKQDVDRNRFKVSALGGTFDHLHDGHKILLSVAALITSSKLIIGVTDQELLRTKKYKEFLEPFQKRCDNVCNFLGLLRDSLEAKVFPLHDVCGPTGTEPEIESLIVSRETVSGGNFVNKTRKERGLQELEIYVVNVLGGDESDGWKGKLSSTVIRKHHAKKPSR